MQVSKILLIANISPFYNYEHTSLTLPLLLSACTKTGESDCFLTENQQLFSYIMATASYIPSVY